MHVTGPTATNSRRASAYCGGLLAIDKGLVNGVVLLDLRKAFDLVNHTVLLEKMANIYGCSQQSMQWFTSYLSERQQFVQFKGKLSQQAEIQTGVPQGSILGPLLFIMFMNDMPLNVSASVDMYADDSTITATGKTTEAVEEKLNNDLHEVSKWCEENKMVINAEKTKDDAGHNSTEVAAFAQNRP